MFLRRCERKKCGKKHTYWALVESIRTARGSRQRVVAYLGELKKSEKNGWAHLARRLNQEERPQPSLFDPPPYADISDDEPVLVKLKSVRLERLRDDPVHAEGRRVPAQVAALPIGHRAHGLPQPVP